jgi:hypothetical protein
MKTKSKEKKKKLTLNKISIARLDKNSINHAKGGADVPISLISQCTDVSVTVYPPQCPSVTYYVCDTDVLCL